jgi:BTB/POZ domain
MRRQDWVPVSLQSSVLDASPITAKEGATSSSGSDAAASMYSMGGLPSANRGIHGQETSDIKPDAQIRSIDETVRINVGGLMFEAYESTLKRDPSSLLAQLHPVDLATSHTHLSPLILPDPEGFYYFDRDW